MKQGAATRSTWKRAHPMPERQAQLTFLGQYSAEEAERIRLGLVPAQMEDKWFIFLEAAQLYLHRSWSGFCMFRVRLEPAGEGVRVAEAWVNRDPEQYSGTDDVYDVALLAYLIDRLLLGRQPPFPFPEGLQPEAESLFRHHMVGWARANDEDPGP
ncbi:MAG: hypothetical protein ACRD2Y_06630 [Terriglobales bacterium]